MTSPITPKNSPTPSPQNNHVTVDGAVFSQMVRAALGWLSVNQQMVNALNVFPIPDGDTGTNMLLTMQAAWREIEQNDTDNIGKVAHDVAHGALMGARGNSGVILSQIWRGFARGLDRRAVMDAEAFAFALDEARETAYKGVMRPVEGTILTVARESAEAARRAVDRGAKLPEVLECVVSAADDSVRRTPELLPVLREAGVVDAGGKGLFFLWEGMLRHLRGLPLDTPLESVTPLAALNLSRAEELIEEGQDYEVVVDFIPAKPLDLPTFYPELEKMGTSIQLGQGDDLYRLHIHVPADKRYEPIEYAMSLGAITKVAIENLQQQVEERTGGKPRETEISFAPVRPDHIAVVAVSPGLGLTRVFASLGVSAVVSGGQTMNPSTEEILASFKDFPCEEVIILPNNKNIVLAAQQVEKITPKRVSVIPTRNIPQGIAAMLAFQQEGRLEAVTKAMSDSLAGVDSGEITVATRSVQMNGVQVAEGQHIGLRNGEIVAAGHTVEETLLALLKAMDAGSKELITLYWGADLIHAKAIALADLVRDHFPSSEVEIHEGGQPHYAFILSVE